MKKISFIFIFLLMFIFIGSVKAANWSDPEKISGSCDGTPYFYKYYGDKTPADCNGCRNTCQAFAASNGATEGQLCQQQCGSGGTNGYCIRVSETCKYTLKNPSGVVTQVFCMQGNVALDTGSSVHYTEEGATAVNSGIACGLLDAYQHLSDTEKRSGWSGNTFSLSNFGDSTIRGMQQKIWAKQYDETTSCTAGLVEFDESNSGSLSITAGSGDDFTLQTVSGTSFYVSKEITVTSSNRKQDGSATLVTAPTGSYLSVNGAAVTGNTAAISANSVKIRVYVPASSVRTGSNDVKVTAVAEIYSKKKYTISASFTKLVAVGITSQMLGYPNITREPEDIYVNDSKSLTLSVNGPTGKITIVKKDDKNAALAGAKFEISLTSDPTIKYTVTIGPDGEGVKTGLAYGTYSIREIEAPQGYVKDSHVETVTISAGAPANYEKRVNYVNNPITVILSKVDFGTKKNLAGAKITVKTLKNGSIVNFENAGLTNGTWTSTNSTITLSKVVPGDYYIYESKIPDGYEGGTYTVDKQEKTAVLHIKIGTDGTITSRELGTINGNSFVKITPPEDSRSFFNVNTTNNKITVYNYKLTTISKKDITGEKELEGAHIVITNDADKDFKKEFVSTKEPTKMYLEKLANNKYYYMTETVAPVGYEALETVFKFTVDENGKPTLVSIGKWTDDKKTNYKEEKKVSSTDNFKTKDTTITILDEPIKIELYKKDSDSKKMVKGAHLVIKDESKKKTIKECDSKNNDPCKLDLEPGTYYLIETKSPDGYEKLSTEYKIQILEDRSVKLLSDKSKEISVSKNTITLYNTKVVVPDTGKSNNNTMLIIGICAAAVAGLGLIIYVLVRRKKA